MTRLSNATAGRLRLDAKLVLLIAVLLVPTLLAGGSYVVSMNDEIDAAHREQAGVDALRPTLTALVALLNPDAGAPDIDAIRAASARHPEFEMDDLIAQVESGASSTGVKGTALAAQSLAALVEQVANRSGLVLDPELDSYYVMDMVTAEFTGAIESHLTANASYINIASTGGTGSEALTKTNVGTQAVLAGVLGNSGTTILEAADTAVANTDDPTLEADLKPMRVFAASLSNESAILSSTLQHPSPSAFTMPTESAPAALTSTLDALDRLVDHRAASVVQVRNFMAGMIAVTAAVALAWAGLVMANTRDGVRTTLAAVGALAKRDLRRQPRVTGKDEFARIGQGLDDARDQLATAFTQLASASGQVAAAASQLTSTTLTVDGSAHETLDQSQSASREITSVQAMLAAVSSSGGELMEATREISSTMAGVNDAAQKARADLEKAASMASVLGDSSQRISDSVSAIVAIAAKTRLLALNATIEAARAGEAGKGFAVVATEVQALAQQSAQASEAIGKVAADQHDEIERVIDALRGAADAVRSAADAQATVAAAAEEQTATIAQVTDSITGSAQATMRIADQVSRVETVATGTAGTVGDLRQAADDFDTVARSLSVQVESFHLA